MTLNLTPGESVKTKLRCTITIDGEDVIGGVQDMVEAGMISSPPPDWVRNIRVDYYLNLIFLGEEPGHRRD